MTPYRVDVRRPDGWHTLTVRAASPEMATSYAYRSTHDALEARQAVVAELPPPKPDMSIAWGITEALIEENTR